MRKGRGARLSTQSEYDAAREEWRRCVPGRAHDGMATLRGGCWHEPLRRLRALRFEQVATELAHRSHVCEVAMPVPVQQHVGWLQVAVHDTQLVEMFERHADLGRVESNRALG